MRPGRPRGCAASAQGGRLVLAGCRGSTCPAGDSAFNPDGGGDDLFAHFCEIRPTVRQEERPDEVSASGLSHGETPQPSHREAPVCNRCHRRSRPYGLREGRGRTARGGAGCDRPARRPVFTRPRRADAPPRRAEAADAPDEQSGDRVEPVHRHGATSRRPWMQWSRIGLWQACDVRFVDCSPPCRTGSPAYGFPGRSTCPPIGMRLRPVAGEPNTQSRLGCSSKPLMGDFVDMDIKTYYVRQSAGGADSAAAKALQNLRKSLDSSDTAADGHHGWASAPRR